MSLASRPQHLKGVNLTFNRVDLTTAPEPVRTWAEAHRHRAGNHYLHYGGKTYLLAAMGEKPSGGYEITIDRVEISPNGEIVVTVTTQSPAPGQILTQALTYPWDLVAIDKNDRRIRFT